MLHGALCLSKSNVEKCRNQAVQCLDIRINSSDWCLHSRWLNQEKNWAFHLNLTLNPDSFQMASRFPVTLFALPHGARFTVWEPPIWISNEGATYIGKWFFFFPWLLRMDKFRKMNKMHPYCNRPAYAWIFIHHLVYVSRYATAWLAHISVRT